MSDFKRTVRIQRIPIFLEEESTDDLGQTQFSGMHADLRLPDNCTIDQASEALQELKAVTA